MAPVYWEMPATTGTHFNVTSLKRVECLQIRHITLIEHEKIRHITLIQHEIQNSVHNDICHHTTVHHLTSGQPTILQTKTELTKFSNLTRVEINIKVSSKDVLNPYPTAFPYGNGMVLHFYQQQESSTTKTVHKVINKTLKAYV